jgi:hypothetical protein
MTALAFDPASLLPYLWPFMGSASGAILSLALADRLSLRGKLTTVGLGFATAAFVGGPLSRAVSHAWPWLGYVEGGVHFLVAISAMTIVPPFLKWTGNAAKDPLGAGLAELARKFLRAHPAPETTPDHPKEKS